MLKISDSSATDPRTSAPLNYSRPDFRRSIGLSVFLFVLASLVCSTSAYAQEDDIIAACDEASRLLKEDRDINGALEEARWCVEGLEQMKQQIVLKVLPDNVGGFTGGETTNQKALGMSMIERDYSRDNEGKAEGVSVSLTAGSGAGGGLAALAQLGLNLGSQGGTKMRIQRRTVVDMSEGSDPTFMVQLKSGGMINITSKGASYETTLEFVKAFPIADVDEALED